MEKGMSRKKVIAVVVAAAIVVLGILAYIMVSGNGKQTYRSIKIVEMEGAVSIERAGKESLNAAVNMNLVSGDYVTTAQDSYVVLRLDADKYVMLGENGAMTVTADGDEQNSRTSIELASGSVLNEIQNPLGQNSTFDVVTPSATMSVRGTVFEVRKNSDGSYGVLVYDGHVAVGLDGMEPVLYDAGEYAEFTEGDSPKFLTEKGAITTEQIDGKVLERLQQIEEQGRNMSLDVIQENTEAVKQEEAARIEAEKKAEELKEQEAALKAKQEEEQKLAEQKEAEQKAAEEKLAQQKAAEQKAAQQKAAQASAQIAQQPQVPAQDAAVTQPQEPEQNLEPAPEPDVDDDDDDDDEPVVPTPEQPSNQGQYKVRYLLPYIVKSVDGIATLKAEEPGNYRERTEDTIEDFKTVDNMPNHNGIAITNCKLIGWCTVDGTQQKEWNFGTDVVTADVDLYPIWECDGVTYVPIIKEDPLTNKKYCNSVNKDDIGNTKFPDNSTN